MSVAQPPIPVELNDLVRRLAEIDRLLDTDDRSPSPRQFELLTERDHLRGLAQCFRTDPDRDRSSPQLEAEKKSLELLLSSETDSRTGFATSKGGGNQSPTSGAWVTLGIRTLAAGRLDRIVARISAIDDELERRHP